jgi:hypothetical protein
VVQQRGDAARQPFQVQRSLDRVAVEPGRLDLRGLEVREPLDESFHERLAGPEVRRRRALRHARPCVHGAVGQPTHPLGRHHLDGRVGEQGYAVGHGDTSFYSCSMTDLHL